MLKYTYFQSSAFEPRNLEQTDTRLLRLIYECAYFKLLYRFLTTHFRELSNVLQ